MQELLSPEQSRIEIETKSASEFVQKLNQTSWGAKIISVNGKKIMMQLKKDDVPLLIQKLSEMKVDIYSVHKKNSLEDYFLSVTGD